MANTQCLNNISAIGALCGQASPLQIESGIFLALSDFEFATYTDAVTLAKWQEAIRDEKIFPVIDLDDREIKDVEDNQTVTPTGKTIFNFEGTRARIYKVTLPVSVHQKLRDYSFQKLRIFVLDKGNNIWCTSPDGTKIKGLKTSYFRIQKQNWEGFVTNIEVNFGDVNEWDKFGKYFNPTWNGSDLEALTKVEITPSTVNQTTHVFTASVAYVDGAEVTSTGISKSVPISGLLAANFNLIKTGDIPTAVDSAVESSTTPGLYTITAHVGTFTAGTVQVKPSTTALYKSDIETVSAAV